MSNEKWGRGGLNPRLHWVSHRSDYSECRRAEQIISDHLQFNGVKGNVFASVPKLGTLREEFTAAGLWVDLPAWVRGCTESLEMVRRAVLSDAEGAT